ncbi:sulfite exporter TauE/SafE family protein [Flaviflexus huanghaiensis]|uniref:sulfite exporter TauE/SafE family protein n=1 Tax=Flaviflexus huanghaiensis TaxID=1111473 RepID=UPI0015FB5A44|nr:sulfite exporter TauE/SafE family protein [Flaviflexus huanghaiensis]
MSVGALALLLAAVLMGGTIQRVSGMGMGLMISPILTLIFGAAVGVTVANVTTIFSAFTIGIVLRAQIDWHRYAYMVPSALVGSIPGGLLVREMDGGWLAVLVGGIILTALALTYWADRLTLLPELRHNAWIIPFAATGAFLNTVSGISAPVLIIYALASRWDQRSFAATLQPFFLWIGLLSVAVKIGVGATPVSDLPSAWVLPLILVTVLAAVSLGSRLALRVSPQVARRIAIAVAGLGAVSTLLRGLVDALG